VARKILVPFELPDPAPLSPVLVEDLASLDIVILGHYALPEQTPPDAARSEFADEAQATLEALSAPFEAAGAEVTTRLVFGRAREKTIDRIAIEEDCDAELDPAPTEGIEQILVPLPMVVSLGEIPDFVRLLAEDGTQRVTLFHVVEPGEDREAGEAMLADARSAMVDAGFDPARVDTELVEAPEHDEAILERAAAYDAVVMHEATPRLRDRIFGTLPDRIARQTGDPVIIVRLERDAE
jgi:nucleotide-binding universal stress UspA family protein